MGIQNMITIYSPTESLFSDNGLAVLQPISCELNVSINGAWSLELTQAIDEDEKYKTIEKNNIIKITDIPVIREQVSQYQLFRIYDTEKDVFTGTVRAIAFPVAFEATYDAIIEELKCDKKTASAALTDIMNYLSDNGVTKYTVTCDGQRGLIRQRKGSWTDTNLIAAISGSDEGSIINHWGGEVAYDNYLIIINGQLGTESDYEIRCGKNLTGLSIEEDMSGVVTRLYPVSKDGARYKRVENNTEYHYCENDVVIPRPHYAFERGAFVYPDIKLIDTSWELNAVNSDTAVQTHTAQLAITAKVKEYAQALWTAICGGNKYANTIFCEPDYFKTILNDVIANLQTYFTSNITHPSLKNLVKTCIKDGFAWIKDEEQAEFYWEEETSGSGIWKYTNGVRTIKDQYYYIDKRYCKFDSTGTYEPPADEKFFDWIQLKTDPRKRFGDNRHYMAHDENVYITMNGTLVRYYMDGDGWYDNNEEESDWKKQDWGTASAWFGEDGATSSDTGKYAHDTWLFIDGTYYYFDSEGHIADSRADYRWDWVEDKEKYWFGNKLDHEYAAVYVADQWLRIDGQWYLFDDHGYVDDMASVKNLVITVLKESMESDMLGMIAINSQALYNLMYDKMYEYCEDMFKAGYDLPVITIKANVADLRKTQEYAEFTDLEDMCLGDTVNVIDYVHGYNISERVVSLKYDCIRGYNTEVVIDDPTRLISQMNINNSVGKNSGNTTRMDYVAGENITIDNGVINASTPSGDVYAGDQVTVTRNVTSGRQIANIKINGMDNKIYGGDDVSIIPLLNQGTKIADYSIDGNEGSLYAPSGLQYWTETEKKINKLTSVALPNHKTWDCDDVWKTTGFELNFAAWEERYPYLFAKTSSDLAFGFYSIVKWNGSLQYEALLISPVQIGACVEKYLEGIANSYEYELEGLTFYKSLGIDMPYPYITPSEAGEPIFHSGHLQYLDYASAHGGEYGTLEETLAYFLEVSNFRTRDIYYSGIGNNNEYVIWGGYSKKSNPEITDMPFYVTDDGVIVCEDIYIDGSKPIKDVRKNGASIVSNQIADITNFTGATAQANGAAGLVPAPLVDEREKFLRGDATWQAVSEIKANPSGTATGTLEKVEIDGTIYEVGGESNLEDLEDVNINNVVGGEMLIYDETSQKWINGTGGGGASEIVTEIIGNHQNFIPKYSSLQSVGWSYDGYALHFSCDDGSESDMKCQAVYRVAIPSTVKKIRYRFQTGVRKSSSASDNYKVCIGIKSTLDTTNYSTPNDSDFITKKLYSTEQHTYEDSIEFTVSEPVYLYIIGNGWFLDVFEIELIEYAGGGGSDEPQKIDMFDGASTITPTASNGITISTSSVSNMVGAISGSEWSNGYEGFNIAVKNLTIGKNYVLKFDWKFTNTAYFVGQYVVGYKLFANNKSNYDDWGAWDENLDRDDNVHTHTLSFQATAATMYLCFNLCGCSDGQVNYWAISNMYLLELPSGGTESPHEIVRQRNVYCDNGTSITLNLTKKYTNPYVMPCNILPLSSWGGLVVLQDTSAISYDSSNDTVTFSVYTNGAQYYNIDWQIFEESS